MSTTFISDFVANAPDLIGLLIKLGLSMLSGSLIGFERGRHGRSAGLRTHILVCLGATMAAMVDLYTAEMIGSDGTRIAANVLTGVGFLGAGVILIKRDFTVKGLTTAAGIWAMAAVGMACGAGMYGIAFVVTLVILAVQLIMHWFNVGNDAYSTGEIRITFVDTPEIRAELKKKQKELGIDIISSRVSAGADSTMTMNLQVRMKSTIPFSEVVSFMDQHPEIKSLSV